ncbi:TRI26 protein, partial [Todus mexicanus]|nr:TRI26 protein [Todus mexicanus]
AKVVEVAKRLSLKVSRGEEEVEVEVEVVEEEEECEKHQEPRKVFCKDDGTFICLVCRESRLHRAHLVVPVMDALQEYKGQIQAHLQALKEERDQLLGFREQEMRRTW